MILKVQIISLIFSFVFGIFIYLILELFNKYIYNKKICIKIIFSLLYSLIFSLLYFFILLNINNGILHSYFFFMIIIGYLLTKYVYIKLFVKR